jgi:DNA-binding winged helix-turn-helix (wHTH) protein/predicted ATPase
MSRFKQKQISFPPFLLDCAEQRLFRNEIALPLRPKSFEVLRYLSERPGKLISKDEILEAVWPGTTITDTVLKVCIREIRETLGDDPGLPRFIETSHRRGYRFIAEVKQSADPEEPARGRAKNQTAGSQPQHIRHGVTDMVGRDAELARLEGLLEESLAGRRQIVFVTGEPGIGKTTLVEAFLNRVSTGRNILSARGQCLEQYGASEAFLPILEAVSRLCREPGHDTLAMLRAHAPTLLAQIPWLIRDHERQALQLEMAGATRERMLREAAEVLEAFSASTPLVIVIEDLHWTDYSTLDLVSYLARRGEPARLMIVGTYRPAEVISTGHPLSSVKRELQAHRLCEELSLTFLNEATVAQYLSARFPLNRFPPALAQLIHRRTDGNPLFILNLVDFLLSKDLITLDGVEWRLAGALEDAEIGMPDNVRQIIDKQIDSLTKEDQRLLEAASVAGVDFSPAAVSSALGVDTLKAEEACEILARRHLFLRRVSSGEANDHETASRYGFIHALYQSALYDRVPSARRAHLHRIIGEHIELALGHRAVEMAAELAMHFERARDYPHAVFYLQRAAENARSRFANLETIELARRGLKLVEKLAVNPERSERELLLQTSFAAGLAATHGYGFGEVEGAYNRARELCQQSGNKVQLLPVLWGLWRFYLIRSDLNVASELAQELLTLAKRGQDTALLVEAHLAAGATFDNIGEFGSARDHFDEGISLYDPEQIETHLLLYGHDPRVVLRCFNAWAMWSLGYPDRAIETVREALAIADEFHHPETQCFALFFAAWTHQLRRESEAALIYADAGIELATKNGIAQWIAFSSSLRGWALSARGDIEQGIVLMRQTLDLYRDIGSEISRPHFLGLLAEALIKTGEAGEALDALGEALTSAHNTGQRYYESELYRLKGQLMLSLAKDAHQAETCFQQALEVARRQRALSFELRAATSLGRLLRQTDRTDEARRILADCLNSFTEGFDTSDLVEAKSLLDEL